MASSPSSDLMVRTATGVVMVVVTLLALAMGGGVFMLFALAVGLGVMWEFMRLVRAIAPGAAMRALWAVGGMLYIGGGMASLLALHTQAGMVATLIVMASVWAVDIGAYFTGRTLGGPKIAPAISPSKTWSGLIGGMVAATLWLLLAQWGRPDAAPWLPVLAGPLLAVVAQAGDFGESAMKRAAGVKDSGTLLPGHGGLFDRIDGLIPVLILAEVIYLMQGAGAGA